MQVCDKYTATLKFYISLYLYTSIVIPVLFVKKMMPYTNTGYKCTFEILYLFSNTKSHISTLKSSNERFDLCFETLILSN